APRIVLPEPAVTHDQEVAGDRIVRDVGTLNSEIDGRIGHRRNGTIRVQPPHLAGIVVAPSEYGDVVDGAVFREAVIRRGPAEPRDVREPVVSQRIPGEKLAGGSPA